MMNTKAATAEAVTDSVQVAGSAQRGLAVLGPITHVVLRIAAGLLFMPHGAQKLFGWFGGSEPVELFSLMGLAGVLEFFGGLLIVAGLFTRPVALLLALQMLAAHFMAHQPQGGLPIANGGELALLYSAVFAYFFAHGAGPASVDARLFGGRSD